MLLAGEAVMAAVLCGEPVQVAVDEIIFSGRETGKEADIGTLCTLNPVKEPGQKQLAHKTTYYVK